MTALPRVCLTAMVCLAVGGCGDNSDAGLARPKANAGRDSGLGVKRFAALDRLFAAAVALDKYRGQDQEELSLEQFRADARPVLKACDALRGRDALMRSIRSGCPLITTFVEQGAKIGTCDGTSTCLRSMRDFRRFVKRLSSVSRRSDRAIAAEMGLTDECKQALRTPPKAYAVFERYDDGMLLMQRALRSPSPAALEKARSAIAAADKLSSELPSNKVLHARFRAGCD